MNSVQSITSTSFYSGEGVLSIYSRKSFSRKPIILGIPIKSSLKDDGCFSISLVGKDVYFESISAQKTLRYAFGIGFSSFNKPDFFNGTLMDDFCFEELSDSVSTFIAGGDLISLNKSRKTSLIGNLKRSQGLVFLNSTFSLSNLGLRISKFNGKTTLEDWNAIEIEIASQLSIAKA
jgi:hypothetical protein